jgi:hypothetical protein
VFVAFFVSMGLILWLWRKEVCTYSLFSLHSGSIQPLLRPIQPLLRLYSASIKTLFRLYQDSLQPLLNLCSASIQAYEGSIQASLRFIKALFTPY